MKKMMIPLTRYAQFNGRASRSEFWWFQLFMLIVSLPLYILDFYAGYSGSQGVALLSTVLSVLMWLVFALPCITATVRRLHDTDRSGWWMLLAFVPFIGLVLLVFMLLPGTPGGNRFGASAPQV